LALLLSYTLPRENRELDLDTSSEQEDFLWDFGIMVSLAKGIDLNRFSNQEIKPTFSFIILHYI